MTKIKKLVDKKFGIFTLDPGGTTGVLDGQFLHSKDMAEVFKRGTYATYQIETWNPGVPPQFAEQDGIQELLEKFIDWNRACHKAHIPISARYFIQEDFVLRPEGIQSTDRVGISPARITSSLLSLTSDWEGNYVFQMPSMGASITNDRLRRLGIWERGMGTNRGVHASWALRHTALWLRSVL